MYILYTFIIDIEMDNDDTRKVYTLNIYKNIDKDTK